MKKFTSGLLNRTKSKCDHTPARSRSLLTADPPGSTGILQSTSNGSASDPASNAPPDSPEANAARGVRLFCESGSLENGGEEVLHLPVIVDAAEGSPAAAAAAAAQIRRFLTKDWAAKPHVQYNAVMLMRILSDHPGASFTRNFDKSFVGTIKEALRNCKDASTQQILRETLDNLEANRQYQEGMEGLIAMWRKEKGQQASFAGQSRRSMPIVPAWNQGYGAPRPHGPSREHSSRHHHNRLPPPAELASRIEEAKNSAKILLQLVQSTPAPELLDNELVREFHERCQAAQRSMQGYINCEDPAPDDDTMLTLIETSEQLSLSATRYQRALLTARRAMGVSSPGQEGGGMMNGGLGGGGAAVSGGADGAPQIPPLSNNTTNYNDTTNGMSAFASPVSSPGEEPYQPPAGPPPAKHNPQSAFAAPPQSESYTAPPGPPPDRSTQPQSDPFADPTDPIPQHHPLEPAHYGAAAFSSPQGQSYQQDMYASSGSLTRVSRRPVSSMASEELGEVRSVSPEERRDRRY